jgi:hypothetical protein
MQTGYRATLPAGISNRVRQSKQPTYALLVVALDDGPLARVAGALHGMPAQDGGVLGVRLGGLDQLSAELLLGVLAILGVEVDDNGEDHDF